MPLPPRVAGSPLGVGGSRAAGRTAFFGRPHRAAPSTHPSRSRAPGVTQQNSPQGALGGPRGRSGEEGAEEYPRDLWPPYIIYIHTYISPEKYSVKRCPVGVGPPPRPTRHPAPSNPAPQVTPGLPVTAAPPSPTRPHRPPRAQTGPRPLRGGNTARLPVIRHPLPGPRTARLPGTHRGQVAGLAHTPPRGPFTYPSPVTRASPPPTQRPPAYPSPSPDRAAEAPADPTGCMPESPHPRRRRPSPGSPRGVCPLAYPSPDHRPRESPDPPATARPRCPLAYPSPPSGREAGDHGGPPIYTPPCARASSGSPAGRPSPTAQDNCPPRYPPPDPPQTSDRGHPEVTSAAAAHPPPSRPRASRSTQWERVYSHKSSPRRLTLSRS